MKILILIFVFLGLNAQAQKTLSPQVFQANVKPVLSGILNDFYQMIDHFPDFPKNLSTLSDDLNSLNTEKEAMRERCPRLVGQKCAENVTRIQNQLAQIQSKTMDIVSKLKMSSGLYMTNISGTKLLLEFLNALEEVKGEVSNSALMIKAEVGHRKETYAILKKLDELSTILSLTIVEFIPYTYKEDFRHFYFNFVHPIQQQMGKNQNYEFLNRNVNSLNFALNLLNMNLTKRNKKTPEGMAPYLSLMHNRWNSLLRYYF
jgi:hypothetical protein